MIKGENPILLNVTYIRPTKTNDYHEAFEVIYKTADETVYRSEEPADADIYIVKPEFRTYGYNKPQERIENMDKVRVRISKIRDKIAEAMGEQGKEFVRTCKTTGNFKNLNQLYRWPYAYGCDFQPEYYFMKNWYEKYPLGNVKLTKAFMDIEIDQIDYKVNLDNISDSAYAPVNVVTVIMDWLNEAYTFILEPSEPSRMGRSDAEYQMRYELYQRQLEAHRKLMADPSAFIKDLHDSFDPVYGPLDYHIRTYSSEIELIADVFAYINDRKPNFCEMWNMRFDIQYLYYRIIALGYDPISIMCHKDFPNPKCYFKLDKSTFVLEKQYDYFYCSSYTQYICQMRTYAAIRKSRHKLKSVKLNYIADIELGDRKVDYSDSASITQFVYDDWLRFLKYNVKDTLLQFGIERKVKDVLTFYMRSHSNLTPYSKIFRETHLLRNVREMYFERDGWVQGNNLNNLDGDDEDPAKKFYGSSLDEDPEDDTNNIMTRAGEVTYKGAINADPIWNDNVGMTVLGTRSNNVFPNAIDYDMGTFYPSLKIASNMDPGTLLYKASFDNYEFISGEFSNRSLNDKYEEKDKFGNIRKLDITGDAVNTYASGNILTFVYDFLGLPPITEIAKIVNERLASKT